MTRRIRYYNQLAASNLDMQDQVNDMVEKAKLAQAILGTDTLIDGFNCTATSPASLSVDLSAITIFKYTAIDTDPFGTPPTQIAADANQILKMGYLEEPTLSAFVAPTTSGYSRNDLIQVQFTEGDGAHEEIGATDNLSFWTGITNGVINPPSILPKETQRIATVSVGVKPGTEAPTGTQTTPAPDAGWTGAWVITTTNGVSTITSGQINRYSDANFILEKLQDKISEATADERYAQIVAVPKEPNIIIGGNFDTNPWSYGTTFTSIGTDTFIANRFKYVKSGTMVHEAEKDTSDPPSLAIAGQVISSNLLVTCTTAQASIGATEYAAIRYAVEGYDWTKYAQKPFLFVFLVKATVTGVYSVCFQNSGADRYYISEITINVADTWELKTIEVPASPSAGTWDYTNGLGLAIYWMLAGGTSLQGTLNTWTTGSARVSANQVNACNAINNEFALQLVALGNPDNLMITDAVTNGFDYGSADEVAAKCSRYVRCYSQGVSGGSFGASGFNLFLDFTIPMRADPGAPTVTSSFNVVEIDGAATAAVTSASLGANKNSSMGSAITITGTITPALSGGKVLYLDNDDTPVLTYEAEI